MRIGCDIIVSLFAVVLFGLTAYGVRGNPIMSGTLVAAAVGFILLLMVAELLNIKKRHMVKVVFVGWHHENEPMEHWRMFERCNGPYWFNPNESPSVGVKGNQLIIMHRGLLPPQEWYFHLPILRDLAPGQQRYIGRDRDGKKAVLHFEIFKE